MALLQPPPEVFDLFDDIMLLSEGQVVYHGAREQVNAGQLQPSFNPRPRVMARTLESWLACSL